MIALGICTFNRPEYAEKSIKAAVKQLSGVVDKFYVQDDGSDSKYNGAYKRAFKTLPEGSYLGVSPQNQGVSHAKNHLLRAMMADKADQLFIMEDDIIVKSPDVIAAYLTAAEKGNFQHLNFALHGPANLGGPVRTDEYLAYYPHSVGAFSYFTSKSLKKVGLFDEHFNCAWEHVQLTLRLARAGYTSGAYEYADIIGSGNYLAEIPGSIERSSIRPRPDWQANIRNGLLYWSENDKDTFNDLFGPGKYLQHYAQSIIGGQ